MATTLTADELAKLSIEERYKLIEMIIESIAQDAANDPPPEWHREIIRERLKRHRENPHEGIPVEEALASLGKRKL